MILELLYKHQEEAMRINRRTLVFPDGISRSVTTWRLVWRWLDALLDYDYCPDECVLLSDVLVHAQNADLSLGEALGEVVQAYIRFIEVSGGDVTDDTMNISIPQ